MLTGILLYIIDAAYWNDLSRIIVMSMEFPTGINNYTFTAFTFSETETELGIMEPYYEEPVKYITCMGWRRTGVICSYLLIYDNTLTLVFSRSIELGIVQYHIKQSVLHLNDTAVFDVSLSMTGLITLNSFNWG